MRFEVSGIQNAKPINITLHATSRAQAKQLATNLHITNARLSLRPSIFTNPFANPFTRKPSPLVLSQNLHLFAIMLDSALPLKDTLESLAQSAPSAFLRDMYRQILLCIQAGLSFQEALAPFSRIFSPMGVALLSAGVESSQLPQMLKILSAYFKDLSNNHANFLKALFYPSFVLLSICVAFVVIAYFVIPQFAELFASFGAVLPLSTQALMAVSSALHSYGAFIALGALLFGAFVWGCVARENALYRRFAAIFLCAPLFGSLVVYRDLWAYFLSFWYLYTARLDFKQVLHLAAHAIQSPIIKAQILQAAELVARGQNLGVAFSRCTFIDNNIKHFLATADKSGQLEQMLELSTKYYQGLYEQKIARILAFIEPLSTMLIALVVAWLAFGIFLPIWELGGINL